MIAPPFGFLNLGSRNERSCQYALISQELDRGEPPPDALIEPWYHPDAHQTLWENEAFALRRRHDGTGSPSAAAVERSTSGACWD